MINKRWRAVAEVLGCVNNVALIFIYVLLLVIGGSLLALLSSPLVLWHIDVLDSGNIIDLAVLITVDGLLAIVFLMLLRSFIKWLRDKAQDRMFSRLKTK